MTDFQVELATVTVLCLMAHMVGDYFIQNDWMALQKTKRWLPAIVHGVTYTIPFVLVTQSWLALLIIGGTHIVLDHYYAAKYVIWAKNQIAPARLRPPLSSPTGFNLERPDWIAVWLLIIIDNCIHMGINVAAVLWL
ncbi:hypothetical protein MYRNA_236 [Mycobacterium phage Myrna]|uniref:Uncharacterized protein n=1 Tax=Mycobacterium phage Myrna TaxID=546805 RepID=B5LJK6_9CAUD|nr:gp236 [Mycobacterium phage Myrna]ACH62203.1 hypothetical protein MYRNA_236 [Mycobacterium phage Myrna]